ncbi:MAG: 30S ribosomal protein S16 [Patescibacteria group bacterium]
MSITIRLAKVGKKHAPAYKVVVANTRDKRNGKFLDVLGYYNPSMNPVEFELDQKKYSDWKSKGALSTKAIEKLVDGTYEFKKYEPNKGEEEATQAEADDATETSSEDDVPAEQEA